MDNRPRSPTPNSGSPYKNTYPVLRSSLSHDILPRSSTASRPKGPNHSNDPDADSEPEHNLYGELSRSQSPTHYSPRTSAFPDVGNSRNQTASASANTQPRRFRATDFGSPVQESKAFEHNSNSLTVESNQLRDLNSRLFEIYTDPSTDAGADAEEPVRVYHKLQQLPPALVHRRCGDEKGNDHSVTVNDNKDKDGNKENIPPDTTIPLEGGRSRLRGDRYRRPLGQLNPSDFYPGDISTCANCSRNIIGAGAGNLRMNDDDGDVFLGGPGAGWASGANRCQIRCFRCWK
ncbi:hypothetical protein RJZ56_007458 [Blastomyces dermatitidis]|uniref:Uncharacterized protein n=3 Tax=Blastomyces TaxID=229219 RepID=A0A179UBJ3_BLAGS|nr:uncharacterized protein BDBG_01642 [Blastomyces gilchristii SLH14081]XP_045276439.1 uncharacterized protein BDCG_04658 [Blastomyces dermatitidis ER-3]EEQ89538.1 hypothetical protein BDCG_04658 [Blastomyces dermatitidis ER-3]EGE86912.1 hypothetical protein BDDG_09863 [Blastomyces dermatitidis ATCC 18188]OAT05210.1 hypothetical protein BDBG_01642 [Blastomyces gilchristii SLH14081]